MMPAALTSPSTSPATRSEPVPVGRVRHVAGDGLGARVADLAQRRLVDVRGHDLRPLLEQQQCDALADPAARAGHHHPSRMLDVVAHGAAPRRCQDGGMMTLRSTRPAARSASASFASSSGRRVCTR